MAKNTNQNKMTQKKKVSKRAPKTKAGPRKKTGQVKKTAQVKKTSQVKKTAQVKKTKVRQVKGGSKKSKSKKTWITKKTVAAPVVRKPTAQESVNPVPELPSVTQLRKVKSGLTRRDLQHYRESLLKRRADILGDVVALESDARTDSGDHLSPEHMADVGSNNFEQEFRLGLVESERKILIEIDEALLRIQDRIYGVCLEQAVPIGKARLDVKPWAKYCIEVVREKERRGEM